MIEDTKWPTEYGNVMEIFDMSRFIHEVQIAHMTPDVIGKMTSIHKFESAHTKNIKMTDKIV